MEILDNHKTKDIVTWLPHGQAFIIYKKKKFASGVLPVYFKLSKFTSFTRKLNRWGFTRITRGHEMGAYFHKFFQRDDPRLCMQMCCQNIRLQNEALALQETHQVRVTNNAAAANNGLPFGMQMAQQQMSQNAMINPLTVFNNPFLQQQQQQMMLGQNQQQQMMLGQFQQQQQVQTAELVRRAMATQVTANASQAQLVALAGYMHNNSDQVYNNNSNNQMMDQSLYMDLLQQTKNSSLNIQPLMMAMQNSLRATPVNMLAQMKQKQSLRLDEAVLIEEPRKSGVPRASAA
jgi:HSF-type DNA-binding